MREEIKVLQVVPSLSKVNGVASYSMNYFKNLENVKMDFIVTNQSTYSKYFDEIESKKCKVFDISKTSIKGIFNYIKTVKKFMKNNAKNYDIIHCHIVIMGVLYLYYAKKYGINVRILHSHATITSDKRINRIISKFILPLTIYYSNYSFACSVDAGKAMFKNKEFTVINNAIDTKLYEYNAQYRGEIRREFNIKDEIVIGCIGRFSIQKNQTFLLDVFKQILNKNENVKLMLVGEGPLEEKIKKYVVENGLEKKVIFTGARNDIYKIYNAFDIMFLPSLYEGLPVVGIEAQCNGLKCIFSDKITKEVQINDNIEFLSIQSTIYWVEKFGKIKNFTRCSNNKFTNSIYNIQKEACKLVELYERSIEYENKKGYR